MQVAIQVRGDEPGHHPLQESQDCHKRLTREYPATLPLTL
jgi:hypothetical protein